MEFINDLVLLPYTLLLFTFKYIIAFGLWYVSVRYVLDHWGDWMFAFHDRFTKPKPKDDRPEDYIV